MNSAFVFNKNSKWKSSNVSYIRSAYVYLKNAKFGTFTNEESVSIHVFKDIFYTEVQRLSDLITYTKADWFFETSIIETEIWNLGEFSTKRFFRVNSNIYKNIFYHNLFELYPIQEKLAKPGMQKENNIIQGNHGLSLYDLVYLDESGLYRKALANENEYQVVGIVIKVNNIHEFTLMTYGRINYTLNSNSGSGILYLSDTQKGKFCFYEDITTNFYTPIGFYINNYIIINVLDSSVGDILKPYQTKIYDFNFIYLSETDENDVIQEVLNSA